MYHRDKYEEGKKPITTATNRLRDALNAAYNMGLIWDHNPAEIQQRDIKFDILFNPIAKIPKPRKFERKLKTYLDESELRTVWDAAPVAMSPVYSTLLKLMICIGAHSGELLRLKVKNLDLVGKSIVLPSPKDAERPMAVPLPNLIIEPLSELIEGAEDDRTLFYSSVKNPKSDSRARSSVFGNQIGDLREYLKRKNKKVKHFTGRDIRRTFKTLGRKAGIDQNMLDELQNHVKQGVSQQHYNMYDNWNGRVEAMAVWEKWLETNVFRSEAAPTQPTMITESLEQSESIDD